MALILGSLIKGLYTGWVQGRRRLAVARQHLCWTWRGGRRSNGQNWRGLLCEERCLRGAEAFSRAEAGGESPSSLSSFLLISMAKWKLESLGSQEASPQRSVPQGTEGSGWGRGKQKIPSTLNTPPKEKAAPGAYPAVNVPEGNQTRKGIKKTDNDKCWWGCRKSEHSSTAGGNCSDSGRQSNVSSKGKTQRRHMIQQFHSWGYSQRDYTYMFMQKVACQCSEQHYL